MYANTFYWGFLIITGTAYLEMILMSFQMTIYDFEYIYELTESLKLRFSLVPFTKLRYGIIRLHFIDGALSIL